MPTWAEAQSAVQGAIAIARRDPAADRYFDLSADSFWRSFGALLYIAPIYLIITLAEPRLAVELSDKPLTNLPDASVLLLTEFLSLGLDWMAYPLAMFILTPQFGLARRFPAYVIVYNWSSLAVTLLIAPTYVLFAIGLLPAEGAVMINFLLILAVLWFRWVVASDVLGAPPMTAAGFVMLDILISLFISLGLASLFIGQTAG
jgi:hypothetical protein